MTAQRLFSFVIAITLVIFPVSTAAQSEMTVDVTTSVICNEATFKTTVGGGTGPYNLLWHFGDTDPDENIEVSEGLIDVMHMYPGPGDFAWEVSAIDSVGAMARLLPDRSVCLQS